MATETETVVRRTEAIEEETRENNVEEKADSEESSTGCFRARRKKKGPKSRRPPQNKWSQQQIPACRPVFTAKHVFVLFLTVGIVFLALGIAFVAVAVRLRELNWEYTGCTPLDTDDASVSSFNSCEDYLSNISGVSNFERRMRPDCHCNLTFTVENTIRYPWKFYYALDNYYQNHRRYLNSWDPAQLRGNDFLSPDANCRPLTRDTQTNETSGQEQRVPIVPCGLIANSWFNDSFYYLQNEDLNISVDLNRNNIAWDTDRDVRFRNPQDLPAALDGTAMPPNWPYNLSDAEIGTGLDNESLIVWFRVSAFPWFRKLYAHPQDKEDLLPGNYSMLITYNYPVDNFDGHKSIVIAELSWLGGRNLFLGIAYIITAVICIITSTVLLIIHLFFSKWKTTDPNFLRRSY